MGGVRWRRQSPRAALGVAAHVNVSLFYQPLTAPTGLGLLGVLAASTFRSGSAWLGRSQKDGLPPRSRGKVIVSGSRPSTRAPGEGQPDRCPFKLGNGRQDARPCFARLPVAVLRNLR